MQIIDNCKVFEIRSNEKLDGSKNSGSSSGVEFSCDVYSKNVIIQ